MTRALARLARPFGSGRGGAVLAVALAMAAIVLAAGGPAAAAPRVPATQQLVVLLHGHVARAKPNADARRIESVPARRPLTGVRTVLPVLGRSGSSENGWLRVRLPGRPNGHAGWISTERTRDTSTPWALSVDLAARRLTVFHDGHVRRRFRVVVGSPSTPTPRGAYFVEEALALAPAAPGGPFALATSARSNVFQEFEGGPGQIGIHGRNHLSGALGTASSHGCVRLATAAITWLVGRVGAGVPLTIRGQ